MSSCTLRQGSWQIGPITVTETEAELALVQICAEDGFHLNKKFVNNFLLRQVIYEKLKKALTFLPSGLSLMVYEAFRPRDRQLNLWNAVRAKLTEENPALYEPDLTRQAEVYISNPHGFGSGHQAATAIDITLCDSQGHELWMGTEVQSFLAQTPMMAEGLASDVVERRALLKEAMGKAGLVNYPDEWWHYSYGDRLWAEVTGKSKAFYAPLD